MGDGPSFQFNGIDFWMGTRLLSLKARGALILAACEAVVNGDRAFDPRTVPGMGRIYWRPLNRRPHIPTPLRRAVFARDGYACVACHAVTALALDHILPYSRGGAATMENLQVLCAPCNRTKGARI